MEVSGQLHAPPLYPHKKNPWLSPGAVLDTVVKRKIPSPRRKSNLRTPIVQPIALSLYRLSLTAFYLNITKL
jgi:hypothetical protein